MHIREKAEVKFEIIRKMTTLDNNLLNISMLCEIADVSRSGYYRWLGAEGIRKAREGQDEQDFGLVLEAYHFRGYAR